MKLLINTKNRDINPNSSRIMGMFDNILVLSITDIENDNVDKLMMTRGIALSAVLIPNAYEEFTIKLTSKDNVVDDDGNKIDIPDEGVETKCSVYHDTLKNSELWKALLPSLTPNVKIIYY